MFRSSVLIGLVLVLCVHFFEPANAEGINDYQTNKYDTSLYKNPNDTYVPSDAVEQGASISSGDFGTDSSTIIDGAATCIALFCIGFVAVVLFNFCYCCGITKCCVGTKFAGKKGIDTGYEYFSLALFIIFVIVCFLATNVLYLGYGSVVEGFDIMRASVTKLGDTMAPLEENLIKMRSLEKPLADATDCQSPYETCYTPYMEELARSIKFMEDDTGDIDDYVVLINDGIDLLEMFITLAMFLMYGLLMISLVFYVLTEICCKTKPLCAICIGNFVFILVSLLGALWMIVTFIIGDLCWENPTTNILEATDDGTKGQMYFVWYSSCYSGFNPLDRYSNKTMHELDSIDNDITFSTDQAVLNASAAMRVAALETSTIVHSTCAPIQNAYLDMVNEGICVSFFEGVRNIWICEVAACISLFFLMVIGAIMARAAKEGNKVHDVMPGADLEMAALATELKNEEPMDQGESGGSEFNNGFGENEESGGDMGGVKDDEVY